MSHELRTPLNAIIGFNDLTLDETTGKLNVTQRSNLQRVSRNARSLLDLINNILDMSKIDAGHMQLTDEHVFPDGVVQNAVSNIETLLAAKKLGLVVQRDDGRTPVLRGDAGRLQQILTNLLSNAVKFTPEYGTITIALEWGIPAQLCAAAKPGEEVADGQWVALSVVDSGVGIEPAELERIWSEFYQVDSSSTRQYGGTGLGLAIVKRLTLLMGGHVGVRSQLGHGSTFTVWLPLLHTEGILGHEAESQASMLRNQETTRW
jgi:signal transduction histidine kinase